MNDLLVKLESGLAAVIYKGIKHAGVVVASYASTLLMKHFGIQMSDAQQLEITTGVTAGLGAGLNLLKQKFPTQLSWL